MYHLAPTGQAGFVLAKGALTSKSGGEGDIRKELVEADLIDCIVNLPAKLFLNTQIPASLWFMSRKTPSLNPSQREGSHFRGGFDFSGLLEEARRLRENQTKAEEIFWELVRNKKFKGLKFRRQHQIGSYIVDFYCHSEKLVIELDGAVHNTPKQKSKDTKRDKYLKSLGNKLLRFDNDTLLNDPETVFKQITQSLSPYGRDGREGTILFIDARNMGTLINRRTKVLMPDDIAKIANTYHAWRNPDGNYEDIKGFCKSESKERVADLDYVLTPGRYVGLADTADDFDFAERFTNLKAEFEAQLKEEAELNERITRNLVKIKMEENSAE